MPSRIICLSLLAALLLPATAAAQDEPPCDPATPAAAHLTGVPKRLAFGRTARASYAPRPNDRIASASITVGDRAPVVVAGPGRTSWRVHYHVLLRDSPLAITLAVVERDPATGVTCRREETRRVRGFRRFFVFTGCANVGPVRPRRICTFDPGDILYGLRWRGWNHRVARANGMLDPGCITVGDCPPDRAAQVKLWRPRFCPGTRGMFYTMIRVRPVIGSSYKRALPCPGSGDGEV